MVDQQMETAPQFKLEDKAVHAVLTLTLPHLPVLISKRSHERGIVPHPGSVWQSKHSNHPNAQRCCISATLRYVSRNTEFCN